MKKKDIIKSEPESDLLVVKKEKRLNGMWMTLRLS